MKTILILAILVALTPSRGDDSKINSAVIIDVPKLYCAGDAGRREACTILTTFPHQKWMFKSGRDAKFQEFDDDPKSLVFVHLGVVLHVEDLEIRQDTAHIDGELTITDVANATLAETVRGSNEPTLLRKDDIVQKKVPFSGSFRVNQPFLINYSWEGDDDLRARIVVRKAVEPVRPINQTSSATPSP